MPSGSRNAEAQTHLASERALQLAEAGADWGITQIRIRNGFIPTENTTMTVDNVGTFTCSYLPGRPDDATDEDLFEGLPPEAVTVHIGPRASRALLRLEGVEEARELLAALVRRGEPVASAPGFPTTD